jgi:hypothetical protein
MARMAENIWRSHEGTAPAPAGLQALRQAATGGHHYLLLLSHMRSYSSLLAHLLGSSPEVDGYGETHVRYRSPFAPWQLRREIRKSTGRPLRGRWLLDKILHNHIRPIDRYVEPARVRALVFLRRPEQTLQSLLTLAGSKGDGGAFRDPQVCCDYYVSRLHRLRLDGERYGRQALYFDAEALLESAQAVLDGVAAWLGLRAALSTQYSVGRRSGEEGFGDWSANIRAGRVLGSEQTTVHRVVALDPAITAEAQAAYVRCRAGLLKTCSLLHAGIVHGPTRAGAATHQHEEKSLPALRRGGQNNGPLPC